jgi:peptidoglycan-associated lipoprotein
MFSRLSIIIFIFSILLVFQPHEGYSQNRRVERADKAFEMKQYNDAASYYQKAYKKVGRKDRRLGARLIFQTAMCYRLTQDNRRAEANFRRAIRLGYEDPVAILYLADALMQNEKYDEALKEYQKYLEKLPGDFMGERGVASAQMALDLVNPETQYIIEIPRVLNSRQNDFTPSFASNQENALIFASSRDEAIGKDSDPWTGHKHTSLFISYQDRSGSWGNPVLLDEGPINTEYNEGAPSVNISGTEMFFTRCTRSPDVDMGCRIFSSRLEGSNWSEPSEVVLTRDSLVTVGHPAISPDDLELFFVSDMPGGVGGLDIWVARRRAPGDSFGPPENLGPMVNTPADEVFPYMRENRVLYFSSEGHPGYGGLDIFKTQRDGNNWTQPQNAGLPFNSPGDDFGITFRRRGESGFFSSNRKGSRGYTIYSFLLPPLEFMISGTVRDEQTKSIITGAVVQLVGSDGTLIQVTTDSRGIYEFGKNVVREKTSYDLLVSKERYFSQRKSESTMAYNRSHNFVHDFILDPIPESPIQLPEIRYEFGRWELLPQFKDSLNNLVSILVDNPRIIIELASHTDSRGTDIINDTLSQRRAQAVVDYLVEQGIEPARMRARGYGKRVPRTIVNDISLDGFEFPAGVVLNDGYINRLPSEAHRDAAHQLNRRTEFSVLSEDFEPPKANERPGPAPGNSQQRR